MTGWLQGAAGRLADLLAASALPWLALTVLAYLAAVWLYQKSGNSPYLIPILPAVALVVSSTGWAGVASSACLSRITWGHAIVQRQCCPSSTGSAW